MIVKDGQGEPRIANKGIKEAICFRGRQAIRRKSIKEKTTRLLNAFYMFVHHSS
jgi:hypothetical protein